MNVTGFDRTGLFGLAASPPEKVQQVDNRSLSMKNNQIVLRLGCSGLLGDGGVTF